MATAENLEAKRYFIAAFFEDLEKKVRFLDDLIEQGHADEARLLCTTYLDGLGNWLRPGSYGSARNFCTVLTNHGGETVLSLIIPDFLLEKLPWGSAPGGAKAEIEMACNSLTPHEAYAPPDFIASVRGNLSSTNARWLETELWRGAVANAVYDRIRSRSVHWLGSLPALGFSKTSYQGQPIPHADFEMLSRALNRIVDHAKVLSLQTNRWFGVS
jgi:hypothetical protein